MYASGLMTLMPRHDRPERSIEMAEAEAKQCNRPQNAGDGTRTRREPEREDLNQRIPHHGHAAAGARA